ncbi:unnamed protein product [marine sediment metagenome]|uniref:Uncharacterized protein n=1 Tax=marine sediment metagenome TaxID=412755 RepID=X1BUW4_9ZZZZ
MGQDSGLSRGRARARLGLGEYENAIADLGMALEIQPGKEEHYIERGRAFHFQGKYQQAIGDFSTVLQSSPQHALALWFRSASYEANKETDKATSDREKALSLDPSLSLPGDELGQEQVDSMIREAERAEAARALNSSTGP